MTDDDLPKSIFDAAATAIDDIADGMIGELNSFKRLKHFLEHETAHLPPFAIARIVAAIDDLHKVCESHIEILALAKLMATNVSAEGQMPSYPFATKVRTPSKFVTITPQVKLGSYRADFVIDGLSGKAFIVECDGRDFHNADADARRDANIEREFGMKTFRITGKEIWRSDVWLPTFGRWCRGNFHERGSYTFMDDFIDKFSSGGEKP